MRVAIVGTDAVACDRVKRALVAAGRVDIATTGTPRRLVASAAERIDLIVFCTPRCDQEAFHAVTVLNRHARVLLIGGPDDANAVRRAIRAGAGGYINADAGADLVAAAAYAVAAGLLFMYGGTLHAPEQPAMSNEHGVPDLPASLAVDLSPREEQVLQLIADGFTHSQVAARIGVTKATVNTYVERIRSKLQLGNKAELTRAAFLRSFQAGPTRNSSATSQ